MKSTLLSLLLLLNGMLAGQVTEDWAIPGSIIGLQGKMVAVDLEDHVFTLSDIFNGDIYLSKRDQSGTLLWDVSYNNTTPSQWEVASWICIDPEGNAIVTGYTNTGFGSEWYPVQMVTMKFDGNTGTLLWRVTENTGSAHRGRTCITDADGNIYVGGDINAWMISHSEVGNMTLVKYDPNGNKLWQTSQDASGVAIPGPLQNLKFDQEGNLIITGSAAFGSQQHTAKFNTAGVCLWHVSYTGYGPSDIAITPLNEVVMMSSYSYLSTSIDIVLRKVSPIGTLIWEETYDFGSAEIGRNIGCDLEGNIIATGYGSQLSGLPYVDWITFKVDGNGNGIWQDRYNEHANNDEWPWSMVIDDSGNAYVTGSGGPWPGYFWTSLTQTVSVKYTPSGEREWTALHTTYSSVGKSICLASDQSLYVVGQGSGVTIHYNQVLPATCVTPSGLLTSAVTASTVRLDWTVVPGALAYEVWGKPAIATSWKRKVLPGTKSKFAVSGLNPNTDYDWKIRTICDTIGTDLVSDFSPIQLFTTLTMRLGPATGKIPSLSVSPNPSSDYLNIQWSAEYHGTVVVTLTNLLGQIAWTRITETNGFLTMTKPIENLPSGLYLLTVQTPDYMEVVRVAIE